MKYCKEKKERDIFLNNQTYKYIPTYIHTHTHTHDVACFNGKLPTPLNIQYLSFAYNMLI